MYSVAPYISELMRHRCCRRGARPRLFRLISTATRHVEEGMCIGCQAIHAPPLNRRYQSQNVFEKVPQIVDFLKK